jgi:hypothetical protein
MIRRLKSLLLVIPFQRNVLSPLGDRLTPHHLTDEPQQERQQAMVVWLIGMIGKRPERQREQVTMMTTTSRNIHTRVRSHLRLKGHTIVEPLLEPLQPLEWQLVQLYLAIGTERVVLDIPNRRTEIRIEIVTESAPRAQEGFRCHPNHCHIKLKLRRGRGLFLLAKSITLSHNKRSLISLIVLLKRT